MIDGKNPNPKQVTVLSGKGGTGKSSIVSALSTCFQGEIVLIDADVDAADLYLIFSPDVLVKEPYFGMKVAQIDYDKCTHCNLCKDSCRFGAISENIEISTLQCEGCALCYHLCPSKAISMVERESGKYMISQTRVGTMTHGKLHPGEESSGKLVAKVRSKGVERAKEEKKKLVLIDGSPGIGCPVISSITGTDLVLLVAEPTLSGFHDLERIIQLMDKFSTKAFIIVNRSDINETITQKIEKKYSVKAPVIAKIPHSPLFTEAMIKKQSVIEYIDASHNDSEEALIIRSNIEKIVKQIREYCFNKLI